MNANLPIVFNRITSPRATAHRHSRLQGGKAGLELLKPAPEDLLQCWPVSKRVNSSRAPDDDPTLIEAVTV